MNNISYITKEFITKDSLEKILKLANLKYNLGGIKPFENYWVPNKKNKTLLVIDINDVNEFGESETEKEALREFESADVTLPFANAHVLDVEYNNYKILNLFEAAFIKLYPDALYYDDEKDSFIKLNI